MSFDKPGNTFGVRPRWKVFTDTYLKNMEKDKFVVITDLAEVFQLTL